MGCIILGSIAFLFFGSWFFATYADPGQLEIMFIIGSVLLALYGGWWLGKHR